LTESVVDLVLHQRRVGLVLWHPTAHNVLLTAGGDNQVIIWNVGTGEALVEISAHTDLVYSACWNWDGSQLVTTCRDKKIRLLNPRTGEVEEEALSHEGSKGTRAIFLRNGLVFTTGFSKTSERQYSLRAPDHLDEPIVMVELDSSNGVMFPLYDADTNIVYLCGKGDSVIRYFEITAEPPFVHYINTFQTPDPQRGIGMMPKRGCDVSICEIARFYRLNNNGFCQVISMTVPRKSELFQEDLYPDTPSDVPAVTAEEWFGGKDSVPNLISMKEGYQASTKKKELKISKKANVLEKPTHAQQSSVFVDNSPEEKVATTTATATGITLKMVEDMHDEIRKLKAMIVKHERRIHLLETKSTCDTGGKESDRSSTGLSMPSETSNENANHSAEFLGADEV